MKQVSVIIPTHNRATLLPAALDSVIAQESVPGGIEVIVIDDGSTDGTDAVIAPYLERYADAAAPVTISYIRLEKLGVVTARNTGIEKTGAPLVAFLDSDDYWAPDKLAKQIAAIDADPGVGLVHSSFRYVDEEGRYGDEGPQRLDNPCVGRCVRTLLEEDLVIFSSVLVKREVVAQAAEAEPHGLPFDPRWTNAQDYDLLLRAAVLCKYAYITEPLTMYRLHGAHGAMGNLPRAFGFHARVQIDFVKRHGEQAGVSQEEAGRMAGDFLFGRAESAFWHRQLATTRGLCDVADELGVSGPRFTRLRRQASRPGWAYAVKDRLDRVLGRG